MSGPLPAIVSSFSLSYSFQEAAARALCNLACDCQNMIAVAEGGAIHPLILLLQSPSFSCCEAAAWALKNIACYEENVKCICDGNGIQGLVSLLSHHISSNLQEPVSAQHWRLIEAIVSALGALTTTTENKYLIGHLGAIDSIVQLIKEDTAERYCLLFLTCD